MPDSASIWGRPLQTDRKPHYHERVLRRMQRARCLEPSETMTQLSAKPRKKTGPKNWRSIDVDNCTGCSACIEVCPVDCIVRVGPYPDAPGPAGVGARSTGTVASAAGSASVYPRRNRVPTPCSSAPGKPSKWFPSLNSPTGWRLPAGPPPRSEASRPRLRLAAERQLRLSKL